MTRSLDDEDKGVHGLHTPGRDQDVTVLTEAGLYAAILGSRVEGRIGSSRRSQVPLAAGRARHGRRRVGRPRLGHREHAGMTHGDLEALLHGVHAASSVERIERGLTREQRLATAAVVDRRLLEAARAGATDEQLAEALGRSVSRTQERLRQVRRAQLAEIASVPPPPPVAVRSVWREVPRCDRPAPPPWPVWSRCRLDVGHAGVHAYNR